ncbi:MAG: hypothetical protein IJ600_01310 [Lachnospiraceae bacterium]|nr:hypothetical protein [Lachnospiraceae bacterium]
MKKVTELTPEELRDRLQGYADGFDYKDKVSFFSAIFRWFKNEGSEELKESPEHANAVKDFLESFFIKKNRYGEVLEDETKKGDRRVQQMAA